MTNEQKTLKNPHQKMSKKHMESCSIREMQIKTVRSESINTAKIGNTDTKSWVKHQYQYSFGLISAGLQLTLDKVRNKLIDCLIFHIIW